MTSSTESSVQPELERAMREWITATSLQSNFLSKVKATLSTELLLELNSVTNEPDEAVRAKIDELVGGE